MPEPDTPSHGGVAGTAVAYSAKAAGKNRTQAHLVLGEFEGGALSGEGEPEMNNVNVTQEEFDILDVEELEKIAGGYDEGGWCGTHPPGWHPPFPPKVATLI